MSPNVVRRLAVGATGVALLATLGSFLHAQAVITLNNPPVAPTSILVFPQRDFVSSSGFLATDVVTVEVFHPGSSTPASSAANVVPQDDPTTPGFDGIVEVNHPGGACWATLTPDIRPGDRVRTTARDQLGNIRTVDETTVANVVAKRPVQVAFDTVVIHGTAQTGTGAPIDITQLEQRLVAPRDAFDLNGRRTLRATSVAGANDGLLTYDPVDPANPTGINWTATYTGLTAADVTRALGAESRILWLGSNPAILVENTVYEIGAAVFAGPAAPCSAPLEVLPPPPGSELVPPSTPTGLVAQLNGTNGVHVSWNASTDNVGVTAYGVYRNGVAITNVQNPDGSAPAPTFSDDLNVAPGTYTYTVDAADAVGNRSGQSNAMSVTTTAQTALTFPACGAGVAEPCVSEPPAAAPTQVQIIAFPARDFTSSSGYTVGDSTVVVQVIRNGNVISTASVVPQDDPTTPGFDGVVEVNHPGGGCWSGVTPDIRAGDIIRQIAYASDGLTIRRVDQTRVANITVKRPVIVRLATPGLADGVVEVHGEAMDANGNPLPEANVTQRLVANRDAFDFNGRRTLRAGGAGKDGAFSYDTVDNPMGTKFTATYSGLDENDVFRAAGGTTSTGRTFPGAESRILWLDDPVLIAPGMTIYENSDLVISGPAAGACRAPIEALDVTPPTTPTSLGATQAAGSTTVHLTWGASTDDWFVNGYGIYRDGVRIRNVGPTVLSYDDVNVPSGNHTYAVDAVDNASPLKVNFAPIPNNPNSTDPIIQGEEWGNRSPQTAPVPVQQPDVLPPTVPANLTAVVQPTVGINLTWSPSTDNVGVASYRVYRGGVQIANVTTTAFTDPVTALGTYAYTVDAIDGAGNASAQTAPVSVTITANADTTPPSIPGAFKADTRDVYSTATAPALGPRDVKLTWTASTDASGVAGYRIYRRTAASVTGTPAAFARLADVNGSTLTYTDLNVAVGTYDYTVDAVDSYGNRSAQAAVAQDIATVNDPPIAKHAILPFSQRDFVSTTGFEVANGPVVISIIRNGKLWARSAPIPVTEDPATPGLGVAEVNHPGGGCWDPATVNGVGGVTPDLRPGDIVRVTNKLGVSDETTTADVYADRAIDVKFDGTPLPAGTVHVHGWAQDATGKPLPISQVQSRIISSSADPFTVNGRRTLRAFGDGTIAYDPISPTNPKGVWWTATYSGLPQTDVDLAKVSESRAVWLGRTPGAGNELTFFENGDGIAGGPAGGVCAAPAPAEAGPAETIAPASPVVASFDPAARTVAFQQQDLGKAVTQSLTISNIGSADATRSITGAFVLGSTLLPMPGDFSVTTTCGGPGVLPPATCALNVTFTPVHPGVQHARLIVVDNANNDPVQMFDLSGEGIDLSPPTVTAPVPAFAAPATITATAVPEVITATATDFSGVASMQLQQSIDGGRTWTDLAPTAFTTTATTATITATSTLSLSSTYLFRAVATDALGHKSTPVVSPQTRMSLTDDAGAVVYNGSWSAQRSSPETAGTLLNTLHIGTGQAGKPATATFSFTGTEVALVSTLGPDRGKVTISVDGGAAQTIDLYAPAVQKSLVVGSVAGLAAGKQHTVTVAVPGTKSAASTGTRGDVDAFVVKF